MKNKIIEDILTIQNILNGDKLAENTLYNKYKSIVENYIKTKYSSSYNEDNVSDIMIKIFANLAKFDSKKSKFSSWVLNITKNHMIDVWRTSKEPTYSINNYSFGEQTATAEKLDNYFSTPSSNFENNNFIITRNYTEKKIPFLTGIKAKSRRFNGHLRKDIDSLSDSADSNGKIWTFMDNAVKTKMQHSGNFGLPLAALDR